MPYTPWSVTGGEQPNADKWNLLGQNDAYFNERLVPVGLISMWSGTLATIPDGWALCDGNGGRPDLRNKFIMGTLEGQNPGDTGGAHSYSLSVAQLPVHTHAGSSSPTSHAHSASSGGESADHSHSVNPPSTNTSSDAHKHTFPVATVAAGAGGAVVHFNYTPNMTYGGMTTDTHYHSVNIGAFNSGGRSAGHTHSITVNTESAHTHGITIGNTGSGTAIDNRPAFFTLAFIIKL